VRDFIYTLRIRLKLGSAECQKHAFCVHYPPLYPLLGMGCGVAG